MRLRKKGFLKKGIAFILALSMVFTNAEISMAIDVNAADVIEISSAEELKKIGFDAAYPMTGDYVLTADIDLSDENWTPMGGYIGTKGTMNTAEANVFSGTFDGQGHVISGMTIDLDGSVAGNNVYAQVGFFSVIAGSSAQDYAVVKNLIFADVDITVDFSDGFASVGTLAGDVNGYSQIDQVVVLDGDIVANMSGLCDTVGVGGLIGECRTNDAAVGNSNISITNCYNGAMITSSGTRSDLTYAGGIIGRVAKSPCKEISGCLNVAIVQYDGYSGYAISSAEALDATYLSTMSNCYFDKEYEALTIGSGATGISKKKLTGGSLQDGLPADIWTAEEGCFPVPTICFESSIAELLYLSGYAFTFAEDESSEEFKTTIALPAEIGGIAVTWTSSNPSAVSIANGVATANTDNVGMDTTVELIATTPSGRSQSYKVTVISSVNQAVSFDANYAKVGTPLKVVMGTEDTGVTYDYTWTVDGKVINNNTNSYTPTKADLESFINVKVKQTNSDLSWELSTYFSELPVVYVNTADGTNIDSNIAYEDGYMKVQGNDEFNDSGTYYDGVAEFKGRGNSTWSSSVGMGVKRPYKIKLDKKANLLGLGEEKNKHWVLMSNMIDHSNMRNELVKDFADGIGMTYMNTTGVVVILNGKYEGTYELCEHKRVGEDRIDVFDWEGLAGDIGEAIAAADASIDEDEIVEAMEQNYTWIDGTFNFNGRTLTIADYWDEEIPEFTGGFFLDMDFRSLGASNSYKYISPFTSSNGIPLFVDGPEYAGTSNTMMTYVKDYINAYEAALKSGNYTTTYKGEKAHYTDLFDMDSLVQYWLVCEYTNNWDSMKNSTLLYKDLNDKAKMGPIWDYDWAFGNINMYSMTGPFVYDNWHTTLTQKGQSFCEQDYQSRQWNHYLVTDPYFVTKAYEMYKEARAGILEDTIKTGGVIDTLEAKYQTASEKNDEKWSYTYGKYSGYAFVNGTKQYVQSQNYNDSVASLKTFITKRVDWLDKQFTSVDNLYKSLGNTVSNKMSVDVKTVSTTGETVATATVTDSNVKYVEFIVNGNVIPGANGSTAVAVTNGTAEVTIDDSVLERVEGNMNTVQIVGLNSSKGYRDGATNFTNFTKAVEVNPIEGTVAIEGDANVIEVLGATVNGYEGTGTLSYQWYADGKAIAGATNSYYQLTEAEIGKKITVVVTSDVEDGKLTSAATEAVKAAVVPEVGEVKTGLIINQIFGGGGKGDTPLSHDFIELYNNSNEDIVLDNYVIGYLSNGKNGSTEGALVEKALSGTVKAKQSYLIRCAENEVNTAILSDLLPYTIKAYDLEWNRVIDNKQYQIIVYDAKKAVVDAVSVGEAEDVNADIEMIRLGGVISKQKSLRRAEMGNFYTQVWVNNDYAEIALVITQAQLDGLRPHSVADGYWAGEPEKVDPTPDPTPDPEPVVATGITVSQSASTLEVGETESLAAAVVPAEVSQVVTWSSSNEAVAVVSATGVVTAKGKGTAVITATTTDGTKLSASCTVTVKKPSVKITGKGTVKRKKSITWTVKTLGVSGKLKVTLDKKGKKLLKVTKIKKNKVTFKAKTKKGTAKVTIKCGKYKATKKLKVK